jgi:serine/threonine protein kinase
MDLRKYLIKSVPPQRFLLEIWRTHSYLLKAIDKLSSNGIVHYDLKDNNIMFDEKLNEPIIIDFGLSFLKSDLKTKNAENVFFTFADYTYWCIDILACSYILTVVGYSRAKTEKVRESQLTEIFNVFMYGTEKPNGDYKIVNGAFEFHLLNSRDQFLNFKERYDTYFSAFVGRTWWEMYEDLIQYVDTWDNYSVAVIYANLLDKGYFSRPELTTKTIEKSQDEMSKYMNGLRRIIYAMPNERATATESLNIIPK